ncbi:MAG: class I adenylate-forming enzyme family protein [Myxococcales bacterium]
MNFARWLLEGKDPRRPALLTLEGDHDYGELTLAVGAVARFLLRAGARPGDCVGLFGENSFFWAAAWLGAIHAGCVAVPISPGLGPEDSRAAVVATRMRFAFVEARSAPACAKWMQGVTQLVLDRPGVAPFDGASVWTLDELIGGSVPPLPVGGGDDTAALLFSSGSMGRPRGVILSHRNLTANTASIVEAIGLTASDRAMAVLPFHYSFGASMLQTHLACGASVVIERRFLFPDKVLHRMIETRCTGFAGVPSHYQILLRRSRFKELDFPDLRWLQQAGGKLQSAFVRELREAKPAVRLYVMYGATEATARLSILPPGEVDARPGSIGRGIPGVTLEVLDEQGRKVAPGETGEIVAQGENIARGYFGDPAETRATFRDGRLHTGDVATVDADGYITVLGRARSFLKVAGTRTSADRFEEALLAFPDVVEVAVIGMPDDLLGEAPAAFVVARDPSDATHASRLRDFARAHLPPFLRPKLIEVVAELPKSPAGKIQRARLHERLPRRPTAA